MSVNAAEIRIEIIRIPFESRAGGAFGIVRLIIHLHGKHILLAPKMHGVGYIDAVCRDSVLIQTNLLAVEKDVPGLPHTLEFEKELMAGSFGWKLEMFAIPR